MDRIEHDGIEAFKTRVLNTKVHGLTVAQWSRLLCSGDDRYLRRALEERFDIKEDDAEKLVK
jgi:hypothetical protein